VVKLARQEAKGDPTLIPREFQGYYFTGPLRPAGKTPRRPVPKHIPRPDYADHPEGLPISEINDKRSNTTIRVYTPEEIEGIREACRIGREVLDAGAAAVKAGVTCEEIDRVVHEATVERNAYPSPLNYHQFPKSLCTSVNEVICHGIPDMRELVDGDIVNLDISVYYNGFHADLNETFFVGKVDSEGRKVSGIYNITCNNPSLFFLK
jgi:methionyl aminopeptidase